MDATSLPDMIHQIVHFYSCFQVYFFKQNFTSFFFFLSSSGVKKVKCGRKIKINSLLPLPYPIKEIFLHTNTSISNKQYSRIQLPFFPLSLLAFIPYINQNS